MDCGYVVQMSDEMTMNILMYTQLHESSRKVGTYLLYKNKYRQDLNSIDITLLSFEEVASGCAKWMNEYVHLRHYNMMHHALNIYMLQSRTLNLTPTFTKGALPCSVCGMLYGSQDDLKNY